jgi:hypothetical protein
MAYQQVRKAIQHSSVTVSSVPVARRLLLLLLLLKHHGLPEVLTYRVKMWKMVRGFRK